jgi:UPF0755 protein
MPNYYANRMKREKQRSFRRQIIITIAALLIIGAFITGYYGYRMVYQPNVWLNGQPSVAFNIRPGSTWEDVTKMLYKNGTIVHRASFEHLALIMKYPDHIKSGHYILKEGMSNKQIISKLRSKQQDPVRLVFNNIRIKTELAGHISEQLEFDSVTLLKLLNNTDYLKKLGFTPENVISMFIPNTYEVYWDISAEKFMERMHKEYLSFWTSKREAKLKDIGLTELQAITMASIVEKESNQNDEKPDIAGVYMNRLKQGWLLQADPTLVYALGDFSIKRVLNVYKTIDSPYNTYKYFGLPPGPICLPSISSIDAVLNYRQHNYMYFCAREDFSGYHNFAVTMEQHLLNAAKYQQALDRQGIMK